MPISPLVASVLAGADNQQATPPSTPLAQPLYHQLYSAAICSACSGTAFAVRSICAIMAWSLEWPAGPDNQRSTAPSTPLAHPLHLRPTSPAICSARSGTESRSVCAIMAWRSSGHGPDKQRSTALATSLAPPLHFRPGARTLVGSSIYRPKHNYQSTS